MMKKILTILFCLVAGLTSAQSQSAEEVSRLIAAVAFRAAGNKIRCQTDVTFYNRKLDVEKFLKENPSLVVEEGEGLPLVNHEIVDLEFECHSENRWKLVYRPTHLDSD